MFKLKEKKDRNDFKAEKILLRTLRDKTLNKGKSSNALYKY